jgi:hypothetical protein
MSSPLAIAAVTAALKDLLNDGLLNHQDLSPIGSFSVTALPPDRVTTAAGEPNQLNLFLYQVTANSGWRNAGLPTRDANGATLGSAPLALDLHYLLTAYGSQDFNAEILLGYAMQLMHDTPVLTRDKLRIVLGGTSPVDGSILPSPFGTLSAADLADQVELIKITPVFLSSEDLSKMWTAMQAKYRQSMAYMVSVVLIQSPGAGRVAPPVLKRGPEDRGPVAYAAPFPAIAYARPAASDLLPALRLGDDVLVTGTNFTADGTLTAVFENTKSKLVRQLAPSTVAAPARLTLHLPSIAENANAMFEWAVGFYNLSLRVTRPDAPQWTSNSVPVALAPLITLSPLTAPAGDINVTITCTPRVRPEQEAQVSLIFGARQITPASIATPGDNTQPTTLVFHVPAVVVGDYVARLRVEGIDSLPVTLTGSPARLDFDPQQKVSVT